MTLSDLISFIGILLAIIAFIGDKERQFIFYKFSKIDIFFTISLFIFINFLLFYNYWINAFPILAHFEFSNFPSPNTWAYLITILFVCLAFYKIFYANFPKNNQKRALNFYTELIQKEDYSFLYSIIVKYESKRLLNNNIDSKYIDSIIQLLFLNKEFLLRTSNYNYQFFNKILLNRNITEGAMVDNYIESHLRNFFSFIYNTNNTELEKTEFYQLANKAKNIDGLLIYIIRNNLVPVDNLLNFILLFSSNKRKVIELSRIILQEVTDKNDNNSLKLFLIEFLKHTGRNNHMVIASFQAISEILIDSINDKISISSNKNIIQLYLDVILLLFDSKKDEIKCILIDIYKTNKTYNSKILFKMIYDTYNEYHSGASIELEITFNEIYN